MFEKEVQFCLFSDSSLKIRNSKDSKVTLTEEKIINFISMKEKLSFSESNLPSKKSFPTRQRIYCSI
jgi:hypothetical protein